MIIVFSLYTTLYMLLLSLGRYVTARAERPPEP
ncbi:hypothetical protein HNQ92_002602 [Rhabdobacter roseus]|uniref:Uncharacterized protein n=1 Tax=Rhabdobacter roseus TaxID=1655419 RepID=A0A840TXT8_9BACT|nr:hypothetical protein [Rhabdobacter roseus]